MLTFCNTHAFKADLSAMEEGAASCLSLLAILDNNIVVHLVQRECREFVFAINNYGEGLTSAATYIPVWCTHSQWALTLFSLVHTNSITQLATRASLCIPQPSKQSDMHARCSSAPTPAALSIRCTPASMPPPHPVTTTCSSPWPPPPATPRLV